MELTKPQRRTNIFDYWNANKKLKLTKESNPTELSITHLEDLSNELFYEIFNYLDVYHVYKGFYSLNLRLQSLLTNSTLPLKINISSMSKSAFQQYNRQILMPNKHRITTLRISNPFIVDLIFSPVRIAGNFQRLETLVFDQIKCKYLPNILHHLASLPELSSLIIVPVDRISNPDDLYPHLFRLPALKYLRMSLETRSRYFSIPPIAHITSPIEHLVIENELLLHQLDAVLGSVPHLRRLSLQALNPSVGFQQELFSNRSNNLTHVFLNTITIPFEQFESMSSHLFTQLKVLRISISNNRDYLTANRWEQLILFAMPQLRIFDFQCRNYFVSSVEHNQLMYNTIIEQFSSPFWNERRWFFAYQCQVAAYENQVMFYSVNPYRRKQYTLYKQLGRNLRPRHFERKMRFVDHLHIQNEATMTNCSHYFSKATKLTLSDSFSQSPVRLTVILKRLISFKQLTTLVIDHDNFSAEKLIKLLVSIPNVHALTVKCQSISEPDWKALQQSKTFRLLSETNKISEVTMRERHSSENIKLFIALCPRIQHLIIDVDFHDLESSVQLILSKSKTNLQQLCLLCTKRTSKSMAGTLKALIESEELLDNYLVKLIGSELYFWW